MNSFELIRHGDIKGGDSILSTAFCWDNIVDTMFCSMTHYDITIGNDVARDVHCSIIMGHDVVMGTYHDVTIHVDVARTLIYYILPVREITVLCHFHTNYL